MHNLAELYPKSFKALAGWTLKNDFGLNDTPMSELTYSVYTYSNTWAFYWKNGNGRDLDILRLFDFFEDNDIKIKIEEYRQRKFEDLFKKLETKLITL